MSDSNSKSTKLVNDEMLRAFAQGQLDEATEDEIVALLDKNPELQAKVAAISIAPVMDKMRAHSQVIGARSLSSQVGGETVIPAAGMSNSEFDLPKELSALSEYRVIRELGRGGMGVVYLAHNKYTDRREVLKVLNERLIENSEAKERFLQEIKVTARLDHPCIVKALGVREVGKTLAFCMEHIKGRDLHGFISEHGKLPVHLACRIAIDISSALQHAMDQGVLHRDIKPSNVMLCKDENGKARAKVLDFGLGRIGDREESNGLTEFGSLLGTLEYISPEQSMNAANVDIRADIYSLGCTLYHMLVGHPPFSGTKGELILAHSRDLPPAVNLIQPTVPRELGGIVSRMLAKQADRRYQRPQEVADALQPFTVRKEKRAKPKAAPSTDGPAQAIKQETAVDVPAVSRAVPIDSGGTSLIGAELPQIEVAPQSVLETRRRPKRAKPSWWTTKRKQIAIGIAAAAIVAIALGAVLRIRTSTGTIVFENLPEDAEVLVDGERVEVTWDGGQATALVKAGDREVQVTQNGVTISGERLKVKRNGQMEFTIATNEEQSTNRPTNEVPQAVSLFNGETTDGWWVPVGKVDLSVEDGQLVAQKSGNTYFAAFATERTDFRNFHLRAELKIAGDDFTSAGDRNCSMMVRSRQSLSNQSHWLFNFGGKRWNGEAIECGLLRMKTGGEPSNKTNRIMPVPGAPPVDGMSVIGKPTAALTRDEWHVIEVIAVGNTIEFRIDGRSVVSGMDVEDRLERGEIAFGVADDQLLQLRNVLLTDLGDDQAAAASAEKLLRNQRSTNEFVSLFDGTKASFERNWRFDQFNRGSVQVQNSEMLLVASGLPRGPTSLKTTERFGNFHLIAEVRALNQYGSSIHFEINNRGGIAAVYTGGIQGKGGAPVSAGSVAITNRNETFSYSDVGGSSDYSSLITVEIILVDDNLATKVDGEVMHRQTIERSITDTPIGLLSPTVSNIAYKKIAVRKLPAGEDFQEILSKDVADSDDYQPLGSRFAEGLWASTADQAVRDAVGLESIRSQLNDLAYFGPILVYEHDNRSGTVYHCLLADGRNFRSKLGESKWSLIGEELMIETQTDDGFWQTTMTFDEGWLTFTAVNKDGVTSSGQLVYGSPKQFFGEASPTSSHSDFPPTIASQDAYQSLIDEPLWNSDAFESGEWSIEDGVIVGNGESTRLSTIREDFRDFELKAKIKLDRQINSGLYFGGTDGFECELCVPSKPTTHALGSMLLRGSTNGRRKPPTLFRTSTDRGEWFDLYVLHRDGRVVVKIDQDTIVDATVSAGNESGPIEFVHWWNRGQIHIRDLQIHELMESDSVLGP